MEKAFLLPSPFFDALRSKNREDGAELIGKTAAYYVEAACREAGLLLRLDRDDAWEEQDTVFFISEAAASAAPSEYAYLREELQEADAAVMSDYYNHPMIVALRGASLHKARAAFASEHTFDGFYGKVEALFPEMVCVQADAWCIDDFQTLSMAEEALRFHINSAHQDRGVRIDFPDQVTIGPEVVIGEGTWIQGSVRIEGQTTIGADCLIRSNSRIVDSTIGDRVRIDSSLIEKSVMEDDSNIGPYSHLRPNAHLGKAVHIGNFVEVKNASLGEGTKAGHLAYVGDAEVGSNVNIGCGVIFVNYDGTYKHRSTVGDRAFIGSNANLVAPVAVQEEAFVAAGSTITKDVAAGGLSIERAVQEFHPGYAARKKKRDEAIRQAKKNEQ